MRDWFVIKYIIKVYRKAKAFGYVSNINRTESSVSIAEHRGSALVYDTEDEAEGIVGVLLSITPRDYAFLIKKKLVVFDK